MMIDCDTLKRVFRAQLSLTDDEADRLMIGIFEANDREKLTRAQRSALVELAGLDDQIRKQHFLNVHFRAFKLANDAWQELGQEMGFDYTTVEPVYGKGSEFFTAEETA